MKYIDQKRKTSPRTRCAKVVKHPKSVTKTGHKRKVPPPNKTKNQLHDTNTRKGVSPPVMKTKGLRNKIRR